MLATCPGSGDALVHHAPDNKTVLGWSEYVDFLDWGAGAVHAKVDTGALTSALHVEDIEANDEYEVSFWIPAHGKREGPRIRVHASVHKWAWVRSSTGHYQRRPFTHTRVRLGDIVKEIEISLVSRESMQFRMLLGRSALKPEFVVDVSRRHALGLPKRPMRKKRAE